MGQTDGADESVDALLPRLLNRWKLAREGVASGWELRRMYRPLRGQASLQRKSLGLLMFAFDVRCSIPRYGRRRQTRVGRL